MKELRKKTILTIFFILTAILTSALTILNVNIYRREYLSIERGLNMFDLRGGFREDAPAPGGAGEGGSKQKPPELNNMMVMDNEVYTVELSADGEIANIISHGNSDSDFDIENIARKIKDHVAYSGSDLIYIGNLYKDDYSYKYRYNDLIVILNNTERSGKLKSLLTESVIIFIIVEGLLFWVSKLITGWIVRPAEEAFKRQKEFIADASHELKTPLAVIMASADELSGDGSPDQNERYIENIRYESDRMSRLIKGLLDLSKLEDDRSAASYKEEDLSKIIEKTCVSFDGIAFEQAVLIKTDIDEDLKFNCNKDEMEKMISTILDNAVKHSYADTTVRVSARDTKAGIVIKIVNSGDPIDDDEREKIFERFYRSDRSRSRLDDRYGLGLAIAKRIALNHNGDIKAYSSGGDTTFEIFLKR